MATCNRYEPGDLLRCTAAVWRDDVTLEVGVIVFVTDTDEAAGTLTIEYESTDAGVPRRLAGIPAAAFEPYVLGPRR